MLHLKLKRDFKEHIYLVSYIFPLSSLYKNINTIRKLYQKWNQKQPCDAAPVLLFCNLRSSPVYSGTSAGSWQEPILDPAGNNSIHTPELTYVTNGPNYDTQGALWLILFGFVTEAVSSFQRSSSKHLYLPSQPLKATTGIYSKHRLSTQSKELEKQDTKEGNLH